MTEHHRDRAERDELDALVRAMEDDGVAFPVRDETLVQWWTDLPNGSTSQNLDARIQGLLQGDPGGVPRVTSAAAAATLGATLRTWRQEAHRTVAEVAREVGLHKEVIAELEADEIYPETQPATTWRRVAAALGRSIDEMHHLIASSPRSMFRPQGIAAARLDREHWDERARFLTRDDEREEASLDQRRAALLQALQSRGED